VILSKEKSTHANLLLREKRSCQQAWQVANPMSPYKKIKNKTHLKNRKTTMTKNKHNEERKRANGLTHRRLPPQGTRLSTKTNRNYAPHECIASTIRGIQTLSQIQNSISKFQPQTNKHPGAEHQDNKIRPRISKPLEKHHPHTQPRTTGQNRIHASLKTSLPTVHRARTTIQARNQKRAPNDTYHAQPKKHKGTTRTKTTQNPPTLQNKIHANPRVVPILIENQSPKTKILLSTENTNPLENMPHHEHEDHVSTEPAPS